MRCVHGELRNDNREVIDDPLVVLGPGAQWADISLHGGVWVMHATLELARTGGFEVVHRSHEPEWRAIDAGDPIETRVLQLLPAARTELAIRVLLGQIEAHRASTRSPIDDDVIARLLVPPIVAIIGAPNVGKSTIANRLFEQQRSIEADLPGTTRDWIGELANLDGLVVTLVDTPGQRASDDAIEQRAIHTSGRVIERAELVVIVLDGSTRSDDASASLRQRYPGAVVVVNKSDRLLQDEDWPADAIFVSARIGHGIERLRRAIRRRFVPDAIDPVAPRVLP
jgi:small GTP-binding protein